MSEKETNELKEFIWLNVFGWIQWVEEDCPHRAGYSLGDETGEKCLMEDMLDPLSPEGSDALDDKILEKLGQGGYGVYFRPEDEIFVFSTHGKDGTINCFAEHPDKKICRALFAKEIFST